VSVFMNITLKVTIWWEERYPDVINICTGDRRFVNDEGARHGLWISIRRARRGRVLWNRLARLPAGAAPSWWWPPGVVAEARRMSTS
jgi:hypothetical protein